MMRDEGLIKAYSEFKAGLARIVRGIVDNPVDVEDIVHEAFVRSLIASRKQKIKFPKAFIATSARNLAINHVTSARYKLDENRASTDLPDERSSPSSMEDGLEIERNLQAYCAAIEQLPVQTRRVFTLKQVYGLSQKEIAARLKISEKTVEYHVSKGLLHCRRFLKALQTQDELPVPVATVGVKRP